MASRDLGTQDWGALSHESGLLLLPEEEEEVLPTAARTHVSKATRAALPISTPYPAAPDTVSFHSGAVPNVHFNQISPR